jgi:hypothetical protein
MELTIDFGNTIQPKPKSKRQRKPKQKQELSYVFLKEKSTDFLNSEIEVFNSFAWKDGYFTSGFSGDAMLLCQMLGNLGSAAGPCVLDLDTSYIVLSDALMKQLEKGIITQEISKIEKKTQKHWQHFKDCWYITETDLLIYFSKRFNRVNDKISLHLYNIYTNERIRSIGL